MSEHPNEPNRGIMHGKAGRGRTVGPLAKAIIEDQRIGLGVHAVMTLVAAGWTLAHAVETVGGIWVPVEDHDGRLVVSFSDSAAVDHQVCLGSISLDEVLVRIGAFPDKPVVRSGGRRR